MATHFHSIALQAKSKAEADLRERKVPMLENEISKLDVLINKKDVEIEELKKRNAAIIEETGKQLAMLEKELKSKNEFIEKQRQTMEGLEAQVAELRALLDAQTQETKTAQQLCKRLEFDYEFLKKNNAALQKEIEELKRTLEVADRALAALEQKEAELQQRHAALQAEHDKCYKPEENVGIGMMLHDDEDDNGNHVVRMKQSVLGGSVWREQINNPSFRLKEGDIILEIDGKPVTQATGIADRVRGREGTTVSIRVKPQHDDPAHSYPYTTTVERRVNQIKNPSQAWETVRRLLAFHDAIQEEERERHRRLHGSDMPAERASPHERGGVRLKRSSKSPTRNRHHHHHHSPKEKSSPSVTFNLEDKQ
jgi:hypothetical protein